MPEPTDLILSEDERRALVGWAAMCAWRVLPLYERACPDDRRLHAALGGAIAFVAGQAGVEEVRKLAYDCHAAARETDDEAAAAVARACGQAVGAAHVGSRARSVSGYALTALTLSGASPETVAAESDWQRTQVPGGLLAYLGYP